MPETTQHAPSTTEGQAFMVGSILDDIANGESPFLFSDLRRQPWMPRPKGRDTEPYVLVRWASRGVGGHRLETIRVPGGRASTKSAVLRFFARLSGVSAPARTHGQREKAVSRAERELETAGL
jgi:hypothetical protein